MRVLYSVLRNKRPSLSTLRRNQKKYGIHKANKPDCNKRTPEQWRDKKAKAKAKKAKAKEANDKKDDVDVNMDDMDMENIDME